MKKIFSGGVAIFLLFSFVGAQSINNKFKTDFTTYEIDNSKCVKLIHKSGSKIFIQDDAFNSIAGKIQILYREFTTPLDMLVNNIPMTTQVGDKTFQLESGGMFEIIARQNGKDIQLKKGKKIEVQLARAVPDSKMNKMKAFQMSNKTHWSGLPNSIKNNSIGNDDELWGSSSVNNSEFKEEEDWAFEEESGWGDEMDEEWQKTLFVK